jgi:AcrR family transcriptional regulator
MTLPLTPQAVQSFRVRLTDLATALYLRDGLEGLSLRALAAAAGVSRSTPYGYFGSKEDIVDSIRAAAFDRLTARCTAAFAGAAGPLARMKALGWAVVRFACDEPDVYRLMFSRPVFEGQVSAPLQEALARFRGVSRPPLVEAMGAGLVRPGLEEQALRRATWAAFHGLISLHLQGHFESSVLAADFELLNQIIAQGILMPGQAQPTPETTTTTAKTKIRTRARTTTPRNRKRSA